MTAQASVFTIHPEPEPGHTITDILPDPKHLVRYIVPKGHKRRFREELDALGINEVSLFPDLEGLSGRVVWDTRVIAYSPPIPPTVGGEWAAD